MKDCLSCKINIDHWMKDCWSCMINIDHWMKDCWSCMINIDHCHESLLIMYHNCWSLDERLLIMYDKHRSLDERLLIMYDKHWSSDERLLIMYDKHWSLPWKLVDHVWCITKSYHHESYRDHYLGGRSPCVGTEGLIVGNWNGYASNSAPGRIRWDLVVRLSTKPSECWSAPNKNNSDAPFHRLWFLLVNSKIPETVRFKERRGTSGYQDANLKKK